MAAIYVETFIIFSITAFYAVRIDSGSGIFSPESLFEFMMHKQIRTETLHL